MAKSAKAKAAQEGELNEDGMVDFDWKAEGIVAETNLSQVVEDNMYTYGTMTVEDRAIPDFRDGFKPVQRRLLWTLYQLKAFSSGSYRKSAKVVGDCMGGYHPHGDQSIYDALVNMASFNNSLIDSMGNWGTLTDPPAAYRYTECRLSKLAESIVLDSYNMAVVEMAPNFDSSEQEPVTFIPNLPLMLLYGAQGIAVGVTVYIPSFTIESIGKLIRAAMARTIKQNKVIPVSARDCAKMLEFHSHTGGHVISNDTQILEFFENQSGRIEWSCDHEWVADSSTIRITGIAPEWGLNGKITKFEEMPEVKQVNWFNDEKSKEQELHVILKRMSAGEVENAREKIEKMLTSAATYRINLVRRYTETVDGLVETKATFFPSTIPEMISLWINWRVKMHKKALAADLDRLNVRLTREELLDRAIDFLDQMVNMLKNKTKGFDKIEALMNLMKITEEDSKSIWAIAIGRFDKLSKDEQAKKIAALKAEIALVNADLKQPFRATYDYIKKATT